MVIFPETLKKHVKFTENKFQLGFSKVLAHKFSYVVFKAYNNYNIHNMILHSNT